MSYFFQRHEIVSASYTIAVSDQDQSSVAELFAGFDANKNLVIDLSMYNRTNGNSRAVVDKDDAKSLASKLNIAIDQLPEKVAKMATADEQLINASPSDVERIFSKVLDTILNLGARYKLISDTPSHQ